MSRIRFVSISLLAAGTLATAGCGESSKSSSQTASSTQTTASSQTTAPTTQTEASIPTGRPLTQAQLIAAADPICARVNAKRVSTKSSTPEELIRATTEISSYERQADGELSKLVPPSALRDNWHAMLADMQTIAKNTAKVGEYTAEKNQQEAVLLHTSNSVLLRLNALARSLGFKDCALP